MARPLKEIDPNLVEKLARIGCSLGEIATIVECSEDTLERRFADDMRKGRDTLKMRLRRKQVLVAMRGNVAMLIWLGKQLLGQVDKQEITERRIDVTVLTESELEAIAALESVS